MTRISLLVSAALLVLGSWTPLPANAAHRWPVVRYVPFLSTPQFRTDRWHVRPQRFSFHPEAAYQAIGRWNYSSPCQRYGGLNAVYPPLGLSPPQWHYKPRRFGSNMAIGTALWAMRAQQVRSRQ